MSGSFSTTPPAFWHRFLSVRWLIPLLILFAALCFFLYTFQADVAQGHLQTEKQAVEAMKTQMTYLQESLEYQLKSGQLDAVHEQVTALGSDESLQQGLLLDEQQRVVARGRA